MTEQDAQDTVPVQAAQLAPEQAKGLLERLQQGLHERFPEASGRLAQLDGHVGTLLMVVEHLFDEDARKGAA